MAVYTEPSQVAYEQAPKNDTLRSLIQQITHVLASARADATGALEALDGEGPKNPAETSVPFTLRQHLHQILDDAQQLRATVETLYEVVGRSSPNVQTSTGLKSYRG